MQGSLLIEVSMSGKDAQKRKRRKDSGYVFFA
jgi:hypothetical protein